MLVSGVGLAAGAAAYWHRWTAGKHAFFTTEARRRGDVVETSCRMPRMILLFSRPPRLCGGFPIESDECLLLPWAAIRAHNSSPGCPDPSTASWFNTNGHAMVPDRPGWGFSFDPDAIRHFAE
jgi:hypothetical protein